MTKDIFIGVDGGATKSVVRLVDSQGQILGQVTSGPANIRLSVDQAWRSIHEALTKILTSLALSLDHPGYRFHAGMGLAGCEVREAYQAYLTHPHDFATLALVSDAHIACLGVHGGNDGAIIIVGTGVIGYQIVAGKSYRASGWGFPHGDEGGGAWLGLEVVRLTLKWLDGRVEVSPLLQAVLTYFAEDQSQLVTWANQANATEFARLAPLVIQYAEEKDHWARHLLQQAAGAINEVSAAMVAQSGALPCCLVGGIAPFITPYLSSNLRDCLVSPQGDACQGAIRLIQGIVREGACPEER
ncbi:MAG: hypothetical protein A3J38_04150 [Gammaproteobacteria bacterium RIFCSPHIGHO2_12_FULL_45_9]|nr:MAG: hypothetical protein A3J38_04150 [Gammaproteobacteria bacterium RIFCSPHIGHO2_12_FULL_45_9]